MRKSGLLRPGVWPAPFRSDWKEKHATQAPLRLRSTFVFFFQAEDGIRDLTVTGVQTCALPIWCQKVRAAVHAARRTLRGGGRDARRPQGHARIFVARTFWHRHRYATHAEFFSRSEERRVGKECRFCWLLYV